MITLGAEGGVHCTETGYGWCYAACARESARTLHVLRETTSVGRCSQLVPLAPAFGDGGADIDVPVTDVATDACRRSERRGRDPFAAPLGRDAAGGSSGSAGGSVLTIAAMRGSRILRPDDGVVVSGFADGGGTLGVTGLATAAFSFFGASGAGAGGARGL